MLTVLLAHWRLVAAAAVLVGLVGAAWQLDARGYRRGAAETAAVWQAREVEALRAANAEILRLQAEVRRRETAAATTLADADRRYQKELSHVRAKHNAFLDDLAAGRLRFYVPAPSPATSSGRGAAAAAAPGRSDEPPRAELPAETARFLYGEATRADEIVEQLGLAQATIDAYLKACR